jgi:hypothetical protein
MSHKATDITISKETMKTINIILSEWGCSQKERLSLLGVSEREHELNSTCGEIIALNIGFRKRVYYILEIYDYLNVIFSNPKNRDDFLKKNNEAGIFNGTTPMNYIIEDDSTDSFEKVHNYLKEMWLPD